MRSWCCGLVCEFHLKCRAILYGLRLQNNLLFEDIHHDLILLKTYSEFYNNFTSVQGYGHSCKGKCDKTYMDKNQPAF